MRFIQYPTSIVFSAALLAGAAGMQSAAAQEPVPVLTGIQWLDWATEQVAFALREADPADAGVEAAPEGAEMPVLSPTHSIETIEMMRLQQEIRLLRELIEEGVVTRVMSLEAEVQSLKAALNGSRGTGPIIPQPNKPSQAQLPPPDASPEGPEMPAERKAQKLPPPEAFAFTVVDEWGRTPEVVAELGGNASTLIGVAGLVPAGSARADVVALAQELRTKYASYDNIVIEVFDSEAAAQAFADGQTVDAESRVLSIAKSKVDGRDLMIYFGGELPEALTAAP